MLLLFLINHLEEGVKNKTEGQSLTKNSTFKPVLKAITTNLIIYYCYNSLNGIYTGMIMDNNSNDNEKIDQT